MLRKMVDKLFKNRYYWIVERKFVLDVLDVINAHTKPSTNKNLVVGNCGWADDPRQYFVHFDVTNNQWKTIVTELTNKKFKLVCKNQPGEVYVEKESGS